MVVRGYRARFLGADDKRGIDIRVVFISTLGALEVDGLSVLLGDVTTVAALLRGISTPLTLSFSHSPEE